MANLKKNMTEEQWDAELIDHLAKLLDALHKGISPVVILGYIEDEGPVIVGGGSCVDQLGLAALLTKQAQDSAERQLASRVVLGEQVKEE